MGRALSLATLLLMVVFSCRPSFVRARDASPWTAGTDSYDLDVNGNTRSFLLHVPARQPRSRIGLSERFPMVIVLHGSGADGAAVRHSSRMDSLADLRRFVVAYPDGSKGRFGLYGSDWNAGTCCGAAARENVDDVAFMTALITEVHVHLPIDLGRVYVAGFSDGGRMAYHLACAGAPLAAIGVVSGSLTDAHCVPTRSVSVIAFHGTKDEDVRYADSAATAPPHPPASDVATLPPAIAFWAAADECQRVTRDQVSPHTTRAWLVGCRDADIAFYSMAEGVHAWPGEPDGPGSVPPMSEIDASDLMLRFFFRHAIREPR